MKLNKDKYGFAIVELALIIAALFIIGFVGVIAYKHFNKTTAEVIIERQKYIDHSISDIDTQDYSSLGTSLNQRGYLTSSFYQTVQSLINNYSTGDFTSNPAYSKTICVDQVPISYTYGPVTISASGNTASVPVNVFVRFSTTPTPYTAYWVNNNGNWQLNNAQCSKEL